MAAYYSRLKKDNRNFFLGAVGERADGTLVFACNGSQKIVTPKHHCEYRLSRKLDKGSTVYVARTLSDYTWANSSPCVPCQNALRAIGVRRVYYTIGPDEFGRWIVD